MLDEETVTHHAQHGALGLAVVDEPARVDEDRPDGHGALLGEATVGVGEPGQETGEQIAQVIGLGPDLSHGLFGVIVVVEGNALAIEGDPAAALARLGAGLRLDHKDAARADEDVVDVEGRLGAIDDDVVEDGVVEIAATLELLANVALGEQAQVVVAVGADRSPGEPPPEE